MCLKKFYLSIGILFRHSSFCGKVESKPVVVAIVSTPDLWIFLSKVNLNKREKKQSITFLLERVACAIVFIASGFCNRYKLFHFSSQHLLHLKFKLHLNAVSFNHFLHSMTLVLLINSKIIRKKNKHRIELMSLIWILRWRYHTLSNLQTDFDFISGSQMECIVANLLLESIN